MNWYYVEAGQQAGPVDEAQLQELVRTSRITGETLVWREGMANWQPYSQASNMAGQGATQPVAGTQAACAECGRIFDTQDMIRHGAAHVCAGCKPVFMQKLVEGARINTGVLNYAGFWIRVGAKLIDGLIVGAFFLVPLFWVAYKSASDPDVGARFMVAQIVIQILYFLGNAAFNIFFIGKFGATPGKMVCKLMVVTADGGKVGYGRATGRFFAEMLSGIICYIGYIMVGFDQQKRALHDHICGTRVVYK